MQAIKYEEEIMGTDLKERLDATQLKELQLISSMIAKGESFDTFNVVWEKFLKNSKNEIKASKNEEIELDINELIQNVLYESYKEINADLQYYAKKIKFLNEQKEQIREHISGILETMQDYINSKEEILSAIGDDAQLANIDLQSALQKQQQTIQMMSNISKTLHDTALAVIRKMG